jgi:hypothetical protein
MRFTLYQRASAKAPFSLLVVPDWRKWVRSAPGRPGYVVQRRIDSLVAPAQYRVVVEMRWINAKGKTLKSKTRTTQICKQPKPATPLQ